MPTTGACRQVSLATLHVTLHSILYCTVLHCTAEIEKAKAFRVVWKTFRTDHTPHPLSPCHTIYPKMNNKIKPGEPYRTQPTSFSQQEKYLGPIKKISEVQAREIVTWPPRRGWTLLGTYKGLQRQCLIGSAVAGFNHAKTLTKASATDLHARQDEYNKSIWSPGSLVNNPVRWDSHDASFPLKGQVVFDFSNVTMWKILFDILQSA